MASGERIEEQLSWVRNGAGDRFGSIELNTFAHVVVSEPQQLDATNAQIEQSPHVLAGPPERMAEALTRKREEHGISYTVFLESDLDVVGPVVASLSGT